MLVLIGFHPCSNFFCGCMNYILLKFTIGALKRAPWFRGFLSSWSLPFNATGLILHQNWNCSIVLCPALALFPHELLHLFKPRYDQFFHTFELFIKIGLNCGPLLSKALQPHRGRHFWGIFSQVNWWHLGNKSIKPMSQTFSIKDCLQWFRRNKIGLWKVFAMATVHGSNAGWELR